MNLCKEVGDNLRLCSDTMYIKDNVYPLMVQRVVDYAKNLGKDDKSEMPLLDDSLSGVDPAVCKAVTGAMLTLVLKSVEMDAGESVVTPYLEECKFTPDRITTFLKILEEARADLRLVMGKIGHCPPHIVDVNWRLDYHIKNSQLEKVDELKYLINLQTERSNGLGNEQIQFECSVEQLQDLVSKLREACKCVERLAQT